MSTMSATSTIVLKPASSAMSATNISPKVTKSRPLPVPLPVYHGCEHIGAMFQNDLDSFTKATDFYRGATRVALDADRLTAQKCARCSTLLTRTFLCMQCPNVHCPKDAETHAKQTKHFLGVDSRSGHVYCFRCQDFIYDPTLEEIRIEREIAVTGGARKRRRLEPSKPSPEDLRYIESNSTVPSCRATGLRGFVNMGSTCFMSVVLQSLIHNPLIRNYYLSDGHRQKECNRPNCMNCAIDEMFCDFFTSDKVEGYGPTNLITISWKCEQTNLAGYQQQDAHEYLQFLLNQLHITSGGVSDTKAEPCHCIIHRSFYGKLQSDVTCAGCSNVTTAHDPVMDLSLDLKLKDKKKSLPVGATGTLQTLQECLERFTSTERLSMNEYNCSNCASPQGATKQLTVYRLPPVLCIQLKRFEHSSSGSQKIETKISFPLQLDMKPYTTRAKRKAANGVDGAHAGRSSPRFLYDLLSVVVHKGEINSGHYICYARENDQWFQFDDSVVTLATEKQVLSAQAYLLTYIIRSLS